MDILLSSSAFPYSLFNRSPLPICHVAFTVLPCYADYFHYKLFCSNTHRHCLQIKHIVLCRKPAFLIFVLWQALRSLLSTPHSFLFTHPGTPLSKINEISPFTLHLFWYFTQFTSFVLFVFLLQFKRAI